MLRGIEPAQEVELNELVIVESLGKRLHEYLRFHFILRFDLARRCAPSPPRRL